MPIPSDPAAIAPDGKSIGEYLFTLPYGARFRGRGISYDGGNVEANVGYSLYLFDVVWYWYEIEWMRSDGFGMELYGTLPNNQRRRFRTRNFAGEKTLLVYGAKDIDVYNVL